LLRFFAGYTDYVEEPENRFLAASDGMDARLIDPAARCLVPVRELLDRLLAECRPHALALGCAGALDRVQRLAAANGADRQRAFVARGRRLDELVASLADRSLAPDQRDPDRRRRAWTDPITQQKGTTNVPLARILRSSPAA
jgi:hypothetical protein